MLARVSSLRELVVDGVRYTDGALAAEVVQELDTRLEGLERDLSTTRRRRRFCCAQCGLTFMWPGELQHHRMFSHEHAEAA